MSRTIRRKNAYRYFDSYYTTEESEEHALANGLNHYYSKRWGFQVYPNAAAKRVLLTGKAFRRGWWKNHNDTMNIHRDRCYDWGQVRAKNNNDLYRWFKDEEHECFFVEDINKRDWD